MKASPYGKDGGPDEEGPNDNRVAPAVPVKRPVSVLAEADTTLRKQCADALMQAGFAVEARDSGIEAVVAARELQPDLIVLGSQLRDVPAREALEWLKANAALRETPILILGATPIDEAMLDGGQRVDVLPRPITALKIQRAIAAYFPATNNGAA